MVRAIRGTCDILPSEVRLWQAIEAEMRFVFELYGFGEIRTPIFEATDLFVRTVGADTDIVSKEMYTFTDRDDTTSLTLRPEGTAPVARAFVEHHLADESRMIRAYYIGPMFRRERPQKGRFRQFHQAGVEVLSANDNPAIEAEVIEMLAFLLERLGVAGFSLRINSIGCAECRPKFLERLRAEVARRSEGMCGDCRRRGETNPMRVFDCKVPSCQGLIAELPTITASLCRECTDHFAKFRSYLDERGLPYVVDPRLVRGLDYYMRTTFELASEGLGAQDTLAAGGRYDGLVEGLDGPPARGFGFAMGLERLILSIRDPGRLAPQSGPDYFLATHGDEAFRYATLLARKLRGAGRVVYLDFDGRSLKSQMRLAGKLGASRVVILGEDEVKSGSLTIRDMTTREQRESSEAELLAGLRPASGDE
jgi:histidyl-tRNA synthetase